MKTPLKVGDRVASYNNGCRLIGIIAALSGDGNVEFVPLGGRVSITIHPKQCRKPVRKKRREVWVNQYSDMLDGCLHKTKSDADAMASNFHERIAVIRFVEAERIMVKK